MAPMLYQTSKASGSTILLWISTSVTHIGGSTLVLTGVATLKVDSNVLVLKVSLCHPMERIVLVRIIIQKLTGFIH